MASQKEESLIKAIVELARDAQRNQTKAALAKLNSLPQTPEVKQLANRLHECDRKIEAQCRDLLRADKAVRKMTSLN